MNIRVYRWYGGKLRVVDLINSLIPIHIAYYEPFMGSGAVLLNHPRSQLEVLNDLDSELVCVMKTLADREKGKLLVDKLCNLWYEKWAFDEAMEWKKKKYKGLDDVDKSVQIYTLITQSFNCIRQTFTAKAYKDTRAYRNSICQNIPLAYERLRDVKVLNMDGIDLLDKIKDNDKAFAFVDPPYRHDLRGKNADKSYACELPHREQIRLLKTIRHAKCKIMLCGYKNEKGEDLYDRYLLPYGWKCYKLAELLKSTQRKKKRDFGKEYIWVNYELPEQAKYAISMKTHSTL